MLGEETEVHLEANQLKNIKKGMPFEHPFDEIYCFWFIPLQICFDK